METIDKIKKILNTNLDIEPEAITDDTTFDELGVDSLDMVELITTVEDEFDIDDFGEPENLETIGDLVEYIDSF